MNQRIVGTVKSREEIESTIDIVDRDAEFNYFLSPKGKLLSVSHHIWDLCGKEISAVSVGRFSTGFDLMYVHHVVVDGCTVCPIIYLQKEWMVK
jgi:hypothetical protein